MGAEEVGTPSSSFSTDDGTRRLDRYRDALPGLFSSSKFSPLAEDPGPIRGGGDRISTTSRPSVPPRNTPRLGNRGDRITRLFSPPPRPRRDWMLALYAGCTVRRPVAEKRAASRDVMCCRLVSVTLKISHLGNSRQTRAAWMRSTLAVRRPHSLVWRGGDVILFRVFLFVSDRTHSRFHFAWLALVRPPPGSNSWRLMRLRKQDLELWFLNILGLIVCARTMLVLTWGSRDASEGLNAKRESGEMLPVPAYDT